MKVVISQPRYLPAINYFQRILIADLFIFLDSVQYSPRDFINRNRIKTPKGWQWLSVPVIHQGQKQLIRDTKIDNLQDWQKKHFMTIEMNYRRAEHYQEFVDFLKDVYLKKKWYFLIDLDEYIINFILNYLNLKVKFIKSSTLKIKGKGQDLLIAICKKIGTDTYISGTLGRNYINQRYFKKANINLLYHDYEIVKYPQLWGEFIPYLSIIDLLLNCGKESLEYIRKNIILREN